MKFNRFFIYLVISLAIAVGLAIHDFRLSKQLVVETDFRKPTARIPMLNPADRVYLDTIVGTPVFFWVHLPMRYDTARVFLEMDNPANIPVKIGFASIPDQSTTPFVSGMELNLPQSSDVKFKLEFPGIDAQNRVIIRKARLEFQRDTFDLIGYLHVWKKNLLKLF